MTTKETWKPVTIGGLTGILMGAGSMYAINNVNSDEVASGNNDDMLKVATVDDNLSFRQAFETARAEVGPGGVFRWHGNIYNTYTAEEWQSMSHESQEQFAERVKPEVSPADIDTNSISDPATTDNAQVAANQDVSIHEEETPAVAASENVESDDPDVRVVGYGHVEVAEGRHIAVEGLEINGERVAVIDVDLDDVADFAMSDVNHNGHLDEGEVIDLHTGEALTFTNDNYEAEEDPNMMAGNEETPDEGIDMMNITI